MNDETPNGNETTDDAAPNDNTALQIINWITDQAINGFGPLSSAESLAQEYLIDKSYPDDGERIEALINWETSKNFTSGFVTGLGGIITLPFSVPAAFGASWLIQARMAAAIAKISGFDIHSDRVKTFVVMCLVGDAMKDIAKIAGVRMATGLTEALLRQIPGKLFVEINKQVGFRLITKSGEMGVINVMKNVPFMGGIVGGSFDAYFCRVVGRNAKNLFHRKQQSDDEEGDKACQG